MQDTGDTMLRRNSMNFSIFTDTSANLPTELAGKDQIGVIPLSYTMDGVTRVCEDSSSFDYETYYNAMKNGAKITTSQINPQSYVDEMEPVLEAGQDILFIGMSAGISGSMNSARIAAGQLAEDYPDRKILLVDSLGAGLGEGILVLLAARYRKDGLSVEQVAARLETEKMHMCQLFTVDDLMHLRNGGRLSSGAALMGTLLNVKPVLKGTAEGTIVAYEKVRGRKAVIGRLAEKYDALVVDPAKQTVGISYCGCREDAELLAAKLRENYPPKEILMVEHEPVTGAYLGKGGLTLFFMGAADVREK